MDKMFWPVKRQLKTVSVQEVSIIEAVKTMKESLEKSLEPVLEYIELYSGYKPFLAINIEDMVQELENSEETQLSDIVSLVKKHTTEKIKVA